MTTDSTQPPQKSAAYPRVRKAVLPAAGLGTRFLPATKAQPKEMLPVVDKPLIQYAVEECVASGIEHVIIVTGRGKNAIEDHFDSSPSLIRFLVQKGHASLAVTGRYVLPREIFSCLQRIKPGRGCEIQLTDALRLLEQEHGLMGLICEGKTFDAWDKLGFLKANVEIALDNPEFGEEFRKYLKSLKL